MRNHTVKRSRPKPDIQPIHVSELLGGAGMTGFLSVLRPPVSAPHLRDPADEAAQTCEAGVELFAWFSRRTNQLFAQLRSQQDALAAIGVAARHVNGGAQRLCRQTESVARHMSRRRLRLVDGF